MLVLRRESEDSMSERPDGYYWVRIGERWSVGYSGGSFVFVDSSPFRESEIDEIGPPCSRDDSEQLAKAREVLRDIQKQSCESGSIRSYVVSSIIDISGVRL